MTALTCPASALLSSKKEEGLDGRVLVLDPPSVVEFTWGAGRLRMELRIDGAGTLLTLTDTFGDVGKAARDAAGWHGWLDRLISQLDGTPQAAHGGILRPGSTAGLLSSQRPDQPAQVILSWDRRDF